jgi:hypothetical protein
MILVLYDVHFHLSILEELAVRLCFLILVCVVQSIFNFTVSAKWFGGCSSSSETNNVQSLTSLVILTFLVVNFSYA